MNKEEKNKRIASTYKKTLLRHSLMDCRTFEIKAVNNKLNLKQKEYINGIYREAKWLRNAYINDPEKITDNIRSVPVKVKGNIENRQLKYLGSQIKQSVIRQVKAEIRSLYSNKLNGSKVGRLKYKPVCNAVNLKQYGTTYSIDFDHNRIKAQNISKPIYVRGLKQIPSDADICNAKLVRKASGLYFYITCYVPRQEYIKTNKEVGIDFGIKHNLTLSDGSIFDISIKENEYIKRKSKKINRLWSINKSHSRNNLKRIKQLKTAYLKQTNRKKDKANKIVHYILNSYDFIAMQDEMVSSWHSFLFGKEVQSSAMGLIKAELKNSSKVHVLDRSFPSTQICPVCHKLSKHPLEKRDYDCLHCGYHHNSRDIKSAQSILDEALRIFSMEHRTQSPGEIKTYTRIDSSVFGKPCVMTQEAQDL